MNLLVLAARFIYEHRASFMATGTVVFTAFLFTSPEPGEPLTLVSLYAWTRSAFFVIFNARHLQPTGRPAGDSAIPKQ